MQALFGRVGFGAHRPPGPARIFIFRCLPLVGLCHLPTRPKAWNPRVPQSLQASVPATLPTMRNAKVCHALRKLYDRLWVQCGVS